MSKLEIRAGKEVEFGKKLRAIIKQAPKDGTDMTAELEPYLKLDGEKVKVYIDKAAGVTKVVLPSEDDLEATLTKLSQPEKELYLKKMGKYVMNRCGK